jgi:colanic acid biosynthesis glycosyl transferase WcaI
MKILLVCAYFPPEIGAAAHLFFELGQALQKRGHAVSVLTGLPRYNIQRSDKYRRRPLLHETYQGLPVWRVFNLDIRWNIPILRGLDEFISAAAFGLTGMTLPSFDLALCYAPPLPLALATLGFARLRGKPGMVNVQDLFPQCAIDLGVLRNPWLIRFFKGLERIIYQYATHLFVHSEGNRRYLLRQGAQPAQVSVIPNWVNTEEITPGPKDHQLREALGLQQRFVVSFAGTMGYSQDLDTVVQAARLLTDVKDIAFLLVGDGVEKPRIENLAREYNLANVFFLPMQPKEEYPKVLAASDLCLVTLRKAVQTPVVPSKIPSIMAAGRPVLASLPLEGDAPRLVAEAQCGISLPPENPELFAEAILKFSQDPRLGEEMGVKGRHYAVQHLSLEACAMQLEKLFEQTIAGS